MTAPPQRPDPAAVAALRAWIEREFNRDRPIGMTPVAGALYQPIPFAEFADLPCERNSSEDRLAMLRAVVPYRGARLLDLGCANGFFLFRLASEPDGIAGGLGLDHFPDNVHVASELVRLYGLEGKLEFRRGGIAVATVTALLAEGPWDVAHLLSVHHHLLRLIGLDETREILRLLYESCGVLVVEQGSLTQAEYGAWTGRDEPFDTGGFSRLVSMLEAAGIPADACRPVGHGKYLSGLRDDRAGSRRVLVAASRAWHGRGVTEIRRKRHRNGIFMELLRVGGSEPDATVWKNVVSGPSLAEREAAALVRLADEPGFPRLAAPAAAAADAADGLLRLVALDLREVTPADVAARGEDLQRQLLARLVALARHGLHHNEIAPPHLLLEPDGTLVLLDFETVHFRDEPRQLWREQVLAPNPALGLGVYPRALHDGVDWADVDLVAADAVLATWGLPPLGAEERAAYRLALVPAAS